MPKDIALVLSSGGARGYAHIGAIRVLEQHGFHISSVAGTSMGALVGGMYAAGKIMEFEEWVVSLDKKEVLRLTDFTISNKGIIKGKKVFDRIKQIVPECNIEDLNIPYCAVATDIINGTERVFESGELYEAIRASVSIPTVFQPYLIDDHLFVDGAILNPIPLNRVHRTPGDLLVVVNVSANIPSERKNHADEAEANNTDNWYSEQLKQLKEKLSQIIPAKKNEYLGILDLTERSFSTMLHKIADLTLEIHKPDILINISKESFGSYDLYRGKEIIDEGEQAALTAISQYIEVNSQDLALRDL